MKNLKSIVFGTKPAFDALMQFSLSIAMLLSCGIIQAAAPKDGNIIINPGFEAPDKLIWEGTNAQVERSSARAHSGKWSLHIKDNSAAAAGYAGSTPVSVSLQGGGRFYAEAWIQIDSAANSRTGYGVAAVDIIFYSNDGKVLVSQPVGRVTSSRGWFRVCNLVTLPYEAAKIGFRVTPASQMPQLMGNVFADDFYLAPLPVAEKAGRVKLLPIPRPPRKAAEYKVVTRPEDGSNMALSVEKLSKGFDPQRPFVIWAIGSSFTDFLGNGEELIAELRKRFPNAPQIVYKKMVGGSTPYNMLRGWARHIVIPDHPDLVLVYNFGNTPNLEKLFAELCSKTTADIIVGSLHWCKKHKTAWPNPETPMKKHVDPKALREACKKYGVEFVETRQDITAYMLANNLKIEDMLVDTVHQSPYMAKIINDSIAAHFNSKAKFSYDPRSRERRIEAGATDAPIKKSGWTTTKDGLVSAAPAGQTSELTVEFTGNRIDLIGQRTPDGGSVSVWLDGKPINQTEAFYAGYIQPNKDNFIDIKSSITDLRRVISDRCPHGIELGKNVVPQKWTITMLTDKGDYELVGSVTGPDGKGNALKPFTSKSGQIIIPPDLWRLAVTNKTGDSFMFEVKRSTIEQIDFKGAPGKFRVCVADSLPDKAHKLTLKTQGNGKVTINAFDVFEPPLKTAKIK